MHFRVTLLVLTVLGASSQAIYGPVSILDPASQLRHVMSHQRAPSLLGAPQTNAKGSPLGFNDVIKVFEADVGFRGKWLVNESITTAPVFNSFVNRNGESTLYFVVDKLDTRITTVVSYFTDEKYIDTKSAYVFFNLTNSTFDNKTSTFYLNITNPENVDLENSEWGILYKDHLYINEVKSSGVFEATLKLKSVATMEPFPLYTNTDPKVNSCDPGFIDRTFFQHQKRKIRNQHQSGLRRPRKN